MSNHLTVHFDGSCWPNPGGLAKFGWVLKFPDGRQIWNNGLVGEGPKMSNNLAELEAMARGMEAAYFHNPTEVLVVGDSEVSLRLMSGRYHANPEKLYYPGYERTQTILKALKDKGVKVEFQWVPRELNQECDDLSKLPVNEPISPDLLAEAEALLL